MSGALRFAYAFVIVIAFGVGCGGGGCGGCGGFEPTPGGFPANERTANAGQLRVTPSGFTNIASDPAALVGGFLGGGGLTFPVPASCGGNTPICCPNGQPVANCGPLSINLEKKAGDDDRLILAPQQGQSRLVVTVRARLKTESDLPVSIPIVGDCGVALDTEPGSNRDVELILPLRFVQDATAGTTRLVVEDLTINRLESNDISLNGGFGCSVANLGLGLFIGTLKNTFADQIKGTIQDQACKKCPSGDVGECGQFASACTNNVCMEGNECLQELGLAGRARGTALFGSLSPGTTGAIDLYEVLGGYATSNNGGLALGMLGGMLPGGAPRDKCGPPATPPAKVTIPQSAVFQGNTNPETGQPFDVAIGLHKSQLDQFAWAGYDGGLLCLTLTGQTIPQLSTGTFSLLARSLGNYNDEDAQMAVGLRPQSPPKIVLGRNVFTDDGMGNVTLTEPLLDITFQAMEIDFFASIDDQFIRVFTVVTDIHLPIGLQTTAMGELQPVIGNPKDAFNVIAVKNSEAVAESPDEIKALFPTILDLALPQLGGALSPIALPSIGNLNLKVTSITSVDNNAFLAIFADLAPAQKRRAVDTKVSLVDVYQPPSEVARKPSRWSRETPPAITISLEDEHPENLEWSYRLNNGAWSAWSTNRTPTIRAPQLWLPATHKLEVRARERGLPETIDPTPAVIEVELNTQAAHRRAPLPFHGQPGAGGCQCDSSGGGGLAALPFALVLLALMMPRRWVRQILRTGLANAKRLGAVAWLAAIACLPGCSCGSDKCGDVECMPGEIEHTLGRFTSIAGDDQRVMVATYEQRYKDLVAVDVTNPDAIKPIVVDGVPTDVTPTYDPSTYRGGIEGDGDDVGAFTSIAMTGGLARIAYQDRDNGALKFAFETERNRWSSHVVDGGNGEEVGRYASLVVDDAGSPAIAYIAIGVDDGSGNRVTELRLARAASATPNANEWTTSVIARANGTCGGLCNAGEACIAGMMGENCAAVTSDCAPVCGSGDVCVAGACSAEIKAPEVHDIATGTGLFAHLVRLADGRLAVAYYDRSARSLKIAVEDAAQTAAFTETVLDGGTTDRGPWVSAVTDGSTVHIAYQDAIGDQLMYTTWNGAAGTPEVVDDGQRAGDRTHSVGAATAIFLVGGSPQIAYQDGLTADVYLATRGGSWSFQPLASGPAVDGFSIAATTGHGTPYLAWDRLDPLQSVPHGLVVQTR